MVRYLKRKRQAEGVVLMEALLAVVIFSVCLTSVIKGFLTGLKAHRYSKEYFVASLLAEEKMFEIYQGASVNERSGVFHEPYQEYRCEIFSDEPFDDNGLVRIRLEVSWPAESARKRFLTEGYVLKGYRK